MTRILALLFALALPSCRSAPAASASAASGPKYGVLAPLDGTVLSIWPEAYAGSWLALEVLPQGTEVAEGDVVARFDARAIDEELHRLQLDLATSSLNHRALEERNRIDTEAAGAALERARAGLDRARRALEGWQKEELAFQRRSDELSRRYEQANLEDQTDELDQLQKMYSGDELVDATEDIVLKRSRRSLALTQTQSELSRDRARYHQELELALEGERRNEDVQAQTEAVARLERQQAIEARQRADAELRSADALSEQADKLARLTRDRAFFELKAPRAGLLLHGAVRDYRPGKTPARLERGSQVAPRAELFVVAPFAPSAAAFDVSDSERAGFASGAKVEVRRLGAAGSGTGVVQLDDYPRALSTSEATLEAGAILAQPIEGARYGERVSVRPTGGS